MLVGQMIEADSPECAKKFEQFLQDVVDGLKNVDQTPKQNRSTGGALNPTKQLVLNTFCEKFVLDDYEASLPSIIDKYLSSETHIREMFPMSELSRKFLGTWWGRCPDDIESFLKFFRSHVEQVEKMLKVIHTVTHIHVSLLVKFHICMKISQSYDFHDTIKLTSYFHHLRSKNYAYLYLPCL